MRFKKLIWLSGFSVIFLFLPSLFLKLWDLLVFSPWRFKMWLLYTFIGILLVGLVRKRLTRMKRGKKVKSDTDLLYLAKKRLAEGGLSLEEYRQIKQELE